MQSLHTEIRPMLLQPSMLLQSFGGNGAGRYTAIKIVAEDTKGTIGYIENVWEKYAIDQPFEYTFLDDDFDQLYLDEERTRKFVTIFTILAMFIASLGLFGLSSFIAEQRTKEVGIRKVLGHQYRTFTCYYPRIF